MKINILFLSVIFIANLVASEKEVHHAPEGIPADKAFTYLVNGNSRYTSGALRKDGQGSIDRKNLVTGQKPHSIVISCSDSRVPPEIIFDEKLGEIFVVRTAGESLDLSGIASVEYAVSHLGSKLIVVMGHESCGAVKAALSTLDGSSAGSPALDFLVKDLHPHLKKYRGLSSTKTVANESFDNAQGAADNLLKKSAIVKEKVENGELVIRVGLYHLATGVVEWR